MEQRDDDDSPQGTQIKPLQIQSLVPSLEDNRYPFCILWTTLPIISWVLPWIGHTGIANSQGVLYDFLGFINKGKMGFGDPIKYVVLEDVQNNNFDRGIHAANSNFCNTMHNLCCNNCHHHVADALNEMRFRGRKDWSQFSIWWMCLSQSHYFSYSGPLRVYAPLLIIILLVLAIIGPLSFK